MGELPADSLQHRVAGAQRALTAAQATLTTGARRAEARAGSAAAALREAAQLGEGLVNPELRAEVVAHIEHERAGQDWRRLQNAPRRYSGGYKPRRCDICFAFTSGARCKSCGAVGGRYVG